MKKEHEFEFNSVNEMLTQVYWGQIFSWTTSLEVKWIAIKCLWILKLHKLGT